MRKPTPETMRHMTTERESILNPTPAENSPETIQSYMFLSKSLASAGSLRKARKTRAETTKEANRARQATQATTALGILRPKKALMRKPTAGNTGISQI